MPRPNPRLQNPARAARPAIMEKRATIPMSSWPPGALRGPRTARAASCRAGERSPYLYISIGRRETFSDTGPRHRCRSLPRFAPGRGYQPAELLVDAFQAPSPALLDAMGAFEIVGDEGALETRIPAATRGLLAFPARCQQPVELVVGDFVNHGPHRRKGRSELY